VVIVFVNRSDNVVQLYDRHGQQIQDIPLPGYVQIMCTSHSSDLYFINFYAHERRPGKRLYVRTVKHVS